MAIVFTYTDKIKDGGNTLKIVRTNIFQRIAQKDRHVTHVDSHLNLKYASFIFLS